MTARRPVWAAIGVVAVMAAVLGGTIRATGGHEKVSACPASYAKKAPWVPEQKARSDRLAPPTVPAAALMCAYRGFNTDDRQSGWKLSGQRAMTAGFGRLAAELTWQPRRLPGQRIPCDLAGGPQTNYLLRLSYSDGTATWVSVTDEVNACVDSSNGDFVSWGNVGPDATRAFRTGTWPRPAAPTCTALSGGRLGQETTMVPPGSVSVTICTGNGRTLTGDSGDLAAALNRLPTRLSTRTCGPAPNGPAAIYKLLFRYPEGPATSVSILVGCPPEIDNLSRQSADAGTILPLLRR